MDRPVGVGQGAGDQYFADFLTHISGIRIKTMKRL
jgi:hypothetical protein